MADFCIPKALVEKLNKAINEESIVKLFDMSKNERIKFLSENSSKELGEKISSSFDDILAEAKRDSFEKTLKSLGLKDKEKMKETLTEIRKLTNDELLDPTKENYIVDKIVSNATGTKITKEETQKIIEIGSKIEKYKSVVDTTPLIEGGKMSKKYKDSFYEMAIAQDEMNKYLSSKTPTSKAETFWGHAKATMLLKPASWLVNIISNTVNSGFEAVARRAGTGRMRGYNSDITKEWKQLMASIYKKTGNDYSRALSLDEMTTGFGKTLGEANGPGKETWLTNLVYKQALGAPDAWSARMNFADAANLYSSKIADGLNLGEGAKKKAGEIMSDALNVIPSTEEGKLVRQMAVADALRATYTNESVSSKMTMHIKKAINGAFEDAGIGWFRGGDLIEPFVKTPANVIEQGLDISGLGALKAVVKTIKGYRLKNIEPEEASRLFMGALKDASKTGLGLIGSFMLAKAIGPDNFMGAYDPNRTKWEQLRNSNYNAIKIGDRWISIDYFGPLGTPLVSMLSAQKYADGGFNNQIGGYLKGTMSQISNLPFVSSTAELYGKFAEASDVDKKKFYPILSKWFMDQVGSRVPGVFSDIAKMTDKEIRDTTTGKFGIIGLNLDPIVAKIPWLANTLPSKRNILGEIIKTEQYSKEDNFMIGLFTTILTGARVKTEQQSPEGKEIYRLYETNNKPTITNWKYIQADKLQKLQDKVGKDKYNEIFANEYGPKYKVEIAKLLQSSIYKAKSDADKKKMIDDKEDLVMNKIYSTYGIK